MTALSTRPWLDEMTVTFAPASMNAWAAPKPMLEICQMLCEMPGKKARLPRCTTDYDNGLVDELVPGFDHLGDLT